MAFPLELVLRICAILAEGDDKSTLKSCALVCSQLVGCCQSYLFAKVKLTLSESVTDLSAFERLATILEHRPELGGHVKSLGIYFSSHSTSKNPTVPYILSKCTNVTAFTMEAKRSTNPFLWPTSFADVTQLAVGSIVTSPNLVELEIRGFHLDIFAFVSPCHANLSSLRIRCTDTGSQVSSFTLLPRPSIHLRYLMARPEIIWDILNVKQEDGRSVFDLSRLEELDACYQERGYMEDLVRVLRRTTSLERLVLRMTRKRHSKHHILNFVDFLKSLL